LIILAQCLGSVAGAILSGFALKVDGRVPPEYVPILAPEKTVIQEGRYGFNEDFQVVYSQILCTFVFVAVILMLKGDKTSPTNDGIHKAGTVAATLWALITLDYHSGACFNPAVALGQTFFQLQHLANNNGYLSHYLYAYTAGPAIGGFLAGIFYLFLQSLHSDPKE